MGCPHTSHQLLKRAAWSLDWLEPLRRIQRREPSIAKRKPRMAMRVTR